MMLFSIGAGGFLGAILRFLMTQQVQLLFSKDFPYGTLLVNALGSFLLGFLSHYLFTLPLHEALRMGLTVGILGAFTTFSTFSMETILFLQKGDFLTAGMNVLSNVGICLILCFMGLQLAKVL